MEERRKQGDEDKLKEESKEREKSIPKNEVEQK